MSTAIDASGYAEMERELGRLLGTERDVLILQGEAILALEATARGVGGPGVRALNLVSGPYGEVIGRWLARGGAEVEALVVNYDRAFDLDRVGDALVHGGFDVLSVVHAEAGTGAVNPLAGIAELAHRAGAIVVVDAVASVGAEPLEIDAWDLDLVVIGPQKALAGPAGVCALIAGARGWLAIERNASAPRDSILSLLDRKRDWIDAGASKMSFYCHEHEMHALQRALAQLDREQAGSGSSRHAAPALGACVQRHRSSRDACRSGLRALGLEPWVDRDQEAAAVATLVAVPTQMSSRELLEQSLAALNGAIPGLLSLAPGPLADAALRINHTGRAAQIAYVCQALTALSTGLRRLGIETDLSAALEMAIRTAKPPASPR